jgi:uncharacterized protein YecE (DUF72 family)
MSNVRIGTSGWSFPEWKETFYAGVPQRRWLEHYSATFRTVEVNMTFRRALTESIAAKWRAAAAPGFRFAIKAHQRITHHARLRDPAEHLPFFVERCRLLGDALGPVLFQTPPNLARDDDRLAAFVAEWPRDLSAAFEFRHDSWFDPEVYAILADAAVALVGAETDDREAVLQPTAPFAYLRLRRDDYPDAVLDDWAGRLTALDATDAWIYFKHEVLSTDRAAALESRLS